MNSENYEMRWEVGALSVKKFIRELQDLLVSGQVTGFRVDGKWYHLTRKVTVFGATYKAVRTLREMEVE